jgi:DNA-binding FadR family transcriptional regulator
VQMAAGGTLQHAIAIHTAVYEAIVAGDGTGARRAMKQILSLASSEIAAATVRRSPQG